MKYSETGQFTSEQIKLAKAIARNIKKLRDSGCEVIGKQDYLHAYLEKDIRHSFIKDDGYAPDYNYPIQYLNCGRIDDAGADDEEYFEVGYIGED